MLIGRTHNDIVEIPMKAGGMKRMRIIATGTAYRHMAALAEERSRHLGGIPHLKSVPVDRTGDPVRDLARIHEEIRRSRAASEHLLEIYSSGAMTLSRLAKALGRSPVDVCLGWPSDAPPLFVGTGIAQERETALEMLLNPAVVLVADSTAISELVRHSVGHSLRTVPKLLVSAATKEVVDALMAEAESDESFGMAFDDGGRLGFVEFDERHKKKRLSFAKTMAEIVELCEVLPAYGDIGKSEEAKSLFSVLGEEEKEMLLLAKERGAIILTLDGRIRALARHVFGIEGVWPQVVVMRAYQAGLVTQREASAFAIGEFLSNRTFVSLSSDDLLWMVSQGDVWLQTGMAAFKRYLASPDTERNSSFEVAIGFLRGVAYLNTQFGAFGELLSHVAEAMFRRADCPPDWGIRLADFVRDLLIDAAPADHLLPAVNEFWNRELAIRIKLMEKRLNEALARSKEPTTTEPIRVRVLHCATKPWLVVDRSSSMAETGKAITSDRELLPENEKAAIGQTSATSND